MQARPVRPGGHRPPRPPAVDVPQHQRLHTAAVRAQPAAAAQCAHSCACKPGRPLAEVALSVAGSQSDCELRWLPVLMCADDIGCELQCDCGPATWASAANAALPQRVQLPLAFELHVCFCTNAASKHLLQSWAVVWSPCKHAHLTQTNVGQTWCNTASQSISPLVIPTARISHGRLRVRASGM